MFIKKERMRIDARQLRLFFLLLFSLSLSGCADMSGVWTGVMLVYDRHNVYKKIDDYQLGARANRLLFADERLRCDGCAIARRAAVPPSADPGRV